MDTNKYTKVYPGFKSGRLTVVKFAGRINKRLMWECLCDCGNTSIVRQCGLIYGGTKSCGCLYLERDNSKCHFVHGMRKTREYRIWSHMKGRCNNPTDFKYNSYGGRGISVCERWDSFESFFNDMGIAPEGTSIDRIDNNGNYEPSNCRWATASEQANNTRRSKFITWNGINDTISGWAERLNMPRDVLNNRIKLGWTMERAITQPVRTSPRRF